MGKIIRTPRIYEPIWLKLKSSPSMTLCVQVNNPRLANRIKRGVIKEKYKDVGFKVINELDYIWLEVEYDLERQVLTFKLRQRLGLEEVKI